MAFAISAGTLPSCQSHFESNAHVAETRFSKEDFTTTEIYAKLKHLLATVQICANTNSDSCRDTRGPSLAHAALSNSNPKTAHRKPSDRSDLAGEHDAT